MKQLATLCEWCGQWVIGRGYHVNGRTFCSWAHYLAWLTRRDRGR